ncbi:MAG: hypothetical protein U0797_11395 [Gemmataceae bacterium]
MPIDTRVQEALRLDGLNLPPAPRVIGIEAEEYVDWAGDDALRVWVTIAEDSTDAELQNGRAIIKLKGAIHDSLLAKGITLFPYIRITKPSERYPPAADDEE